MAYITPSHTVVNAPLLHSGLQISLGCRHSIHCRWAGLQALSRAWGFWALQMLGPVALLGLFVVQGPLRAFRFTALARVCATSSSIALWRTVSTVFLVRFTCTYLFVKRVSDVASAVTEGLSYSNGLAFDHKLTSNKTIICIPKRKVRISLSYNERNWICGSWKGGTSQNIFKDSKKCFQIAEQNEILYFDAQISMFSKKSSILKREQAETRRKKSANTNFNFSEEKKQLRCTIVKYKTFHKNAHSHVGEMLTSGSSTSAVILAHMRDNSHAAYHQLSRTYLMKSDPWPAGRIERKRRARCFNLLLSSFKGFVLAKKVLAVAFETNSLFLRKLHWSWRRYWRRCYRSWNWHHSPH